MPSQAGQQQGIQRRHLNTSQSSKGSISRLFSVASNGNKQWCKVHGVCDAQEVGTHCFAELAGDAALLARGVAPEGVLPPEPGTECPLLKGVVHLRRDTLRRAYKPAAAILEVDMSSLRLQKLCH